MPMFGLQSRLRFVIGPPDPQWPTAGLREVDIYAIYAAGRWVTCDDSKAHLSQFAGSLAATVGTLLDDHAAKQYRLPYPDVSVADNHRRLCQDATAGADGEYQRCRFMNWGPTTDNVLAHLFLADGLASIAFSFWREQHHDPAELAQVFVAELPERELLRLLHRAAWSIVLGGT